MLVKICALYGLSHTLILGVPALRFCCELSLDFLSGNTDHLNKLLHWGGVLRPGDELMQISPTRSELMIEAKVSPADVGQLREGLPVTVKIDAFDYTIHGSLTGTLTHISSDTLTESGAAGQTNLYYRAQISLDSAQVNKKLALTDLKPGMTASVDIRTGYRSILGYIFKPVAKAFEGAGSQR